MKNAVLSCLFCLMSCFSVFSQEARKIDTFTQGMLQCGDFQGRINSVAAEYINGGSPKATLFIIYYGGRYRKTREWNENTKSYIITSLAYPHRNDGRAWAKSIPTYIQHFFQPRELINDKIVLVNGGYRENIEADVWYVPENAKVPTSTPTFQEKDIKFLSLKSIRTPNLDCCYSTCRSYLYF